MGEPNVLTMLIGGSFASGEADVYSDLDLQLVVQDEAVEATTGELRRMAGAAGPVAAAFSPSMWASRTC
jgi:predicted nucleotidyltransferase